MSRRNLRLILWALVAINLAALAWVGIVAPRMNQGVLETLGQGEYRLQIAGGGDFNEDTLKDGPSLVFFGFTHCPDVCPTTLGDILTWQEQIEGAEALKVFFVTVDPERDTPEVLGEYVGWVPGVKAVTGSPEEVQKALQAFRIYAAKVPLEGGDYTMDHSASVLLFDGNGGYAGRIQYQEDMESVAAKLAGVLGT
jgi:protein SCO1/2